MACSLQATCGLRNGLSVWKKWIILTIEIELVNLDALEKN
jgi:hypothetical protein